MIIRYRLAGKALLLVVVVVALVIDVVVVVVVIVVIVLVVTVVEDTLVATIVAESMIIVAKNIEKRFPPELAFLDGIRCSAELSSYLVKNNTHMKD